MIATGTASGKSLCYQIAIAEALTGKALARYWLHSELLLVDGKKMSTENDNVVILKDLLAKGYTGREIRFFLVDQKQVHPIMIEQIHQAQRNALEISFLSETEKQSLLTRKSAE